MKQSEETNNKKDNMKLTEDELNKVSGAKSGNTESYCSGNLKGYHVWGSKGCILCGAPLPPRGN